MNLTQVFRDTFQFKIGWPFPKETEAVQVAREEIVASVSSEAADFIELYVDYADVFETPRAMHSAAAIQIVASILNRNGVLIPHGAIKYPLDLWTVLLSGSGHGRSTLVNVARSILDGADATDLIRSTDWGSAPAFLQDMAERPTGLFVWGELSKVLKQLNKTEFTGVKQTITDQYDSLSLPDARRYRKTGRAGDTPDIEFKTAPRINILATSSEDWFFSNLEEEDSGGGFIPRWLLVRSTDPTRDVPTPPALDGAKARILTQCVSRLLQLSGPADISGVLPNYEEWYGKAKRRFEGQPNRGLAEAFFNRHRVQILKLAVIYEAATSYRLTVSESSWNRAVAAAAELEATIYSLLGTGMNSTGYTLKKMEDVIKQRGKDGITQSEFTRAFQSLSQYQRESALKTLIDGGRIQARQERTQGRPVTFYTHEECVKKEVPERFV